MLFKYYKYRLNHNSNQKTNACFVISDLKNANFKAWTVPDTYDQGRDRS